jgi:hypothetical protein
VTAQGGSCALAEVIVAIDTSAAAIRILNVVIVILRIVVMCGEFAPAIAAALLKTLPGDFSRQALCRRCVEESSSSELHSCANGILARVMAISIALMTGAALRTRWQSIDLKSYLGS